MRQKATVDEVNRMTKQEFVARFGTLYEHSPWVADGAYSQHPFGGISELHEAFARTVRDAPRERQVELIRSHPDLAGKAAMAGELTDESTAEQSSAGLDRLSPQEYETFTRINREYRDKFGMPMVVAVREHTRESIIAQAKARLSHSRDEEIETALGEIDKIAWIRLQDRVAAETGAG
ncbi:MAG TPA: 2-oxo-4-hydroxy-4-carboxy-5-ureidoimidazoline decarboxylase [Rubrobacteraceae bacterium]|nr:2-oxo-4-hydroxy-4-carboxy-5-ureidoimidazoline decarboxylase [Rubrobacteraceae bacterium]